MSEKNPISQEPEVEEPVSSGERLAAADALKTWIEQREPENRHILEKLESDLRQDRRLNEWGQFALEDLLRPPRRDLSQILLYDGVSR